MEAGLPALIGVVAAALPFASGLELAINTGQVVDDKQVSDHHAIIPTPSMAKADFAALPAGERDLLTLVAVRLLCAVGEKHTFEAVAVTIDCADHNFTAKGRTVLHDGWKAIDRAFRASLKHKPDEDSGEEDTAALPELAEGQEFAAVSASIREGKTSPPARFTEGALLLAMERAGAKDMLTDGRRPEDAERRGLGTPATRAGVIERIIKSGFVQRKGKMLVPTERGVNLIAALPDTIKSPALTADWEHQLCQIERGELAANIFMDGIANMTRELVAAHPAPDPKYIPLFVTKPQGEVIGSCPRCGSGVTEGQKGFFCSSRICAFALWKDSKFWSAKKKQLTAKIVGALLTEGRVSFSDLYSGRTGKTYAATILLDDTGDKVNFKMEFESGRSG